MNSPAESIISDQPESLVKIIDLAQSVPVEEEKKDVAEVEKQEDKPILE